ncbi:MAG TPA: hypothetical protein VLW54_14585 [Candidatus Acidoferrales bacterium]|nr:hypothetical protein [Candidatus Acidoferrales bacterium]
MNWLEKVLLGFSVFALLVVLAIPARAGIWNEKTELKFSEPVEVPGRVLPAGRYIFKLFNSPSDRDIVEIMNGTGTRLVDIVDAMPVYRYQTTANPVVTLESRGAHTPEGIDTWFYPAKHYGLEFLYPTSRKQRG